MATGGVETEVKIRIPDLAQFRERVEASGFTLRASRQFESNTLYDTADHSLRRAGIVLRLRQSGDKSVITWKGPGEPGPFKTRPELETSIGSLETMQQILGQLGFAPVFCYEKFRAEFVEPGHPEAGTLTLDETPIGSFLELEGAGPWIDDKARQLGFSRADYVLDSYAKLYLDDCRRRGVEPAHMIFARHRP